MKCSCVQHLIIGLEIAATVSSQQLQARTHELACIASSLYLAEQIIQDFRVSGHQKKLNRFCGSPTRPGALQCRSVEELATTKSGS